MAQSFVFKKSNYIFVLVCKYSWNRVQRKLNRMKRCHEQQMTSYLDDFLRVGALCGYSMEQHPAGHSSAIPSVTFVQYYECIT